MNTLVRNNRGAVTLEAAIIVPVFVVAALTLTVLLRIAVVEVSLQHAVDEAVQQLATALHPLERQLQEEKPGGNEAQDIELALLVPEPVRTSIVGIMNGYYDPLHALILMFVPERLHGGLLRPHELVIEQVVVPYMNNSDMVVGVVVRYELRVPLPFIRNRFVVKKSAFERVWFGA